MPYKCCVPNCRGNYAGEPKVRLFSFPRDVIQKRKWVKAICRQNFTPSVYTKVCEYHFNKNEIETEVSILNGSLEYITVPLKVPRLRSNTVPSILPNCPGYLSSPSTSTASRESVQERMGRKEMAQMKIAISKSIETGLEYNIKNSFNTFNELCNLVKAKTFGEWSMFMKEECIIFGYLVSKPVPLLCVSAAISKDLQVSIFKESQEIKKLCGDCFPKTINSLNELEKILDQLNTFRNICNKTVDDHIQHVHQCLSKLSEYLENTDDHKKVNFIIEQVNFINKKQYAYSPHTTIFCSILESISPHSYKFLRNSGYLTFPHPQTLQRVCSKYNVSPLIEEQDENFLSFIRKKIKLLNSDDLKVTLMLDEIHIKSYMDYKAGNIVGAAYDSENAASSVHVFMVQSLLSPYKEVVHMLPVKKINAEQLHCIIKKIILSLEDIGFNVISVVSDNNAINRKSMSYFVSPPRVSSKYQHPSNSAKPLFYILDPVHIYKCIRNNWVNQKDLYQTFLYPSFEDGSVSTATFSSIKRLHELESSNIVKFSYGLTMKSLCPSSFERQNVKLVMCIFNDFVVQALMELGVTHSIPNFKTTADFIKLITRWWSIVNVKSYGKSIRYKDAFQEPLTLHPNQQNTLFLKQFSQWLDSWNKFPDKLQRLTNETHSAISQTTNGLLEMAEYCLNELNFKYFLPGKIQTDALETRFGKYRTLAGSQYLITIRQIYECEAKLRIQNLLPLTLKSCYFGEMEIDLKELESDLYYIDLDESSDGSSNFNFIYEQLDIDNIKPIIPVLIYLAGYCARSAINKIKCDCCSNFIVMDRELQLDDSYRLIRNMDRGGLLYPQPDVINAIIYNYLTVQKLISPQSEKKFLEQRNQKQLVINLSRNAIFENELFLSDLVCNQGHKSEIILNYILKSSTNALLNNYVKKKNDCINMAPKKQRKLFTVKKNIL